MGKNLENISFEKENSFNIDLKKQTLDKVVQQKQETKLEIIRKENQIREWKKEISELQPKITAESKMGQQMEKFSNAFASVWLMRNSKIRRLENKIHYAEREITKLKEKKAEFENIEKQHNLEKGNTTEKTAKKLRDLEEKIPSKWKKSPEKNKNNSSIKIDELPPLEWLEELNEELRNPPKFLRKRTWTLEKEKEILTKLHHAEAKINGKIQALRLENMEIDKIHDNKTLQNATADIVKIYKNNQRELMELEKQRTEALYNSKIQAQKIMELEAKKQ